MRLARQQQELQQFAAEEIAARRIVEGEGRQRVEHPVLAGDASVGGLAAQDGDDVLRRDARGSRDALQNLPVREPETHAIGDTLVGHEVRAVLPPGQHGFGGTRDLVDDAGVGPRVTQDAGDPGARQRRLLGGGGNEALDFRPRQIKAWRLRRRPHAAHSSPVHRIAVPTQPGLRARADHYEPTSFRCEYMDIRIPKPASRVTIEVPP